MRKILDPKFWSHGTPLGSVRALFSKPLPKRFRHIYYLVVLRVLELPLVVVFMVDFLFTGIHWGHLCHQILLQPPRHNLCPYGYPPFTKVQPYKVHSKV